VIGDVNVACKSSLMIGAGVEYKEKDIQ